MGAEPVKFNSMPTSLAIKSGAVVMAIFHEPGGHEINAESGSCGIANRIEEASHAELGDAVCGTGGLGDVACERGNEDDTGLVSVGGVARKA